AHSSTLSTVRTTSTTSSRALRRARARSPSGSRAAAGSGPVEGCGAEEATVRCVVTTAPPSRTLARAYKYPGAAATSEGSERDRRRRGGGRLRSAPVRGGGGAGELVDVVHAREVGGAEFVQQVVHEGIGQLVAHLPARAACPHPSGVPQQRQGVRGGGLVRPDRPGQVRAAHLGMGVQTEEDPQPALVGQQRHPLGELLEPVRPGEQPPQLGDELLVGQLLATVPDVEPGVIHGSTRYRAYAPGRPYTGAHDVALFLICCEVYAMIDLLWGLGGMAGLLLIAVALSSHRRASRLRTVIGAFALRPGLGVSILYWGPGQWALQKVSAGFQAVIDTSGEGISFLFGGLLPAEGEGSIFALQVLPVIVFFASLTAVLYHWKILPKIVQWLGGGLGK